jgi:hypothetical protein
MDKQFYLPFEKVVQGADGSCIVAGYASTPTRDLDGEIITLDAVRKAMPSYWQYANIREMHQAKAAGIGVDYKFDKTGWWLKARIVDPVAVKKCVEGVYKGFSIGGKKTGFDKDDPTIITGIDLLETSIVDRPANPECKMALAKRAKEGVQGYLMKASASRSASSKALSKMAQAVELLAKDGPPAAHDGFSLPAKVLSFDDYNPSPKDVTQQNNKSAGACDKHNVVGCKECAAKAEGCKAHGLVDCPDCQTEKRDFSAAERRTDAGTGAAMSDGSYPIHNQTDLNNAWRLRGRGNKSKSSVIAHIRSRAQALGLKVPGKDKKPTKKQAKKLAKIAKQEELRKRAEAAIPTLSAPPPSFLVLDGVEQIQDSGPGSSSPRLGKLGSAKKLKKRMGTAGSLAYCFDSIRSAQRSLLQESSGEGGDKKDKALALKLGPVARSIAEVISEKASHEGQEALDFSDVDDTWIQSLLEGDMDKGMMLNKEDLTPMESGLIDLIAKAAAPTRAQRMQVAMGHMKKIRKARKDAMDAVEAVHKALSRTYMMKMDKAAKDKKPDDDDMEECSKMLKMLSKAHGALGTIKTYGKAVESNISKAAEGIQGRSGQRGQEVGDRPGDVPYNNPGTKDMSPGDMARTGPAGGQRGSSPPMYPTDGSVFPGKIAKFADKDGKVPVAIAELMAENAKLSNQVDILHRVPGGGGNTPVSFDMNKVFGGQAGGGTRDLNAIMFEGVDMVKLASNDETVRGAEAAKAAGNYLTSPTMARSVSDGNFRGGAGLRRQ